MPQFGQQSVRNLYECEQPLIDLFEEVVKHYDCSIIEGIRSQEEQDKLTPDQVYEMLKEGNRRFVSGTLTSRDHSKQVRAAWPRPWPRPRRIQWSEEGTPSRPSACSA